MTSYFLTEGTKWTDYSKYGLYVDIDIKECDFKSDQTPIITTVLAGTSRHWLVDGGSRVYNPSSAGFR